MSTPGEKEIKVKEEDWLFLQENLLTLGSALRRILEQTHDAENMRTALNALIRCGMTDTFLSDPLDEEDY